MPTEIAVAILDIMSSLDTLKKSNDNTFENYKFASIDDFIGAVRDKCYAAGLLIVPQEAREPELKEMKKKDGTPYLMWHSRFAFMLVHKTGAGYGPIFKTVMVQANGAQAAGSAQSYALKQLMRSLFLIPTGDGDDPDKKETANLSSASSAPTDMQRLATQIKGRLNNAKDLDDLNDAWESNVISLEDIKVKSAKAFDHLSGVYDKKKASFE